MVDNSVPREQHPKRSYILFATGLVGVACLMSVLLLWLNLDPMQRNLVLEYFGWGDSPVRLDIEGIVRDDEGLPVERDTVAEAVATLVDLDDREGPIGCNERAAPALYDESAGSRVGRHREMIVSVVVRTADCEEERALAQRAGIDRGADGSCVGVSAQQIAAGPAGDVPGRERDGAAHVGRRAPSARRASTRSSKGNFSRPMIW